MRLRIWLAVLAVGLGTVAGAARGLAGDRGPDAAPAVFQVGAAVAAIDPDPAIPVFSGGFGKSPPIIAEYGPLQVRALYVSNGRRSVAMATVDSQAYFAAYQEGPAYGITSVREVAAAAISGLGGPAMTRGDIIVQGTHSHSAATLEGIWGPVPPSYLRKVHDQSVAALVAAARSARPAHLQWATIDAPYLDNIYTAQTDSYVGWTQDGQVSVLRALDPATGATVATFANIPAHPDIVNGADLKVLGADYFGPVREALETKLGGVALVGPATLGREESPIQVGGIAQMRWYAGVVENLITEALTHARWVTDPSIASSESLVQVPGTNVALLGLNAAWALPDAQKQQILGASGIYPIDRANTPPYLTGTVIGTYLTALRIGGLAYVSMPGEPFPEVRLTIARSVQEADMVVGLNKGQDDWGYWYPSWATPFTMVYHSDHLEYNVSPFAGDEIIQQQLHNLGSVGFTTTLGIPTPLPTDWGAALRPGLQALASPASGDAGPDGSFTTIMEATFAMVSQPWDASPANLSGQPQLKGSVHWDMGDGTTHESDAWGDGNGSPVSALQVHHAYGPGVYTVKLQARDTAGNRTTWSMQVAVYPRLRPSLTATSIGPRTWRLELHVAGGDGSVLAQHWSFSDGATADGPQVVHRFNPGAAASAVVTVVDGTGSKASTTWAPGAVVPATPDQNLQAAALPSTRGTEPWSGLILAPAVMLAAMWASGRRRRSQRP